MTRHRAITLLLSLLLSVCGALTGRGAAPAVRLRYQAGVTAPDLALGDNARALNVLARDLRAISARGAAPALEVMAYTSPDAENSIAYGVALNRARALAALMASRDIMDAANYSLRYEGIGWPELLAMVEADSAAPRRAQLLHILRATDAEAAAASPDYSALLRHALREMDRGRAWRHMESHFFPIIRNTLLITMGADTARVVYRIGYNDVDLAHARNGARLERIIEAMRRHPGSPVTVEAFLEPTGDNLINRYIALERFGRLRAWLAREAAISPDRINLSLNGNGWAELTHCLAMSSVSWRHEAMAVIAGAGLPADALAAVVSEQRKRAIKALDGGRTWNTLCSDYFPALRGVVLARAMEASALGAVAPQSPAAADTIVDGRWSLGTNLLYDAALAPTLEVGVRLGGRWSLRLEGSVAWWRNASDGRTYQLALISPEARYRFSGSSQRRGHFAGAFGAVAIFDLSNRSTGHRGEAYMGGLTYTWAHPLSATLSLETTLGAGYLWATYRDYTPRDGHHVYRRTRHSSYVGPLKARVALVWHIDTHRKSALR